jgi:hypothetical protein
MKRTIKNIHNRILGIFFTCEKSIRQPIGRQLLLMITIMITTSQLEADIKFKGICNSYQIDVDITSNRYTDLYCFSQSMLVWDTEKRVYKMVKPISGGVYTGMSVQTQNTNGSLKEEKWLSVDKNKIKYVGKNAGLTMVLAGSFIGFTILFFTSFLFIEVVKK